MRYRNWTSWILAALVTPVFMGCSQGAEEPSERIGQTLEKGPEPGRHEGRRGFMADPAKLIERLDANKDGTLEASELPSASENTCSARTRTRTERSARRS